MKNMWKSVAAKLPVRWQRELRRIHFSREIARGKFRSEEPEYFLLPSLLKRGQWAVDIGANVGHYTARCSELVGREGRVIAFEPVPETFAILAWNLQLLGCANVTLVNTAISDKCEVVAMTMPYLDSGLRNFYQARIAESKDLESISSLAISLEQLRCAPRIALIKIDVEGHEAAVLRGLSHILQRDQPIVILETSSGVVQDEIIASGYSVERLNESPNLLCKPIKGRLDGT